MGHVPQDSAALYSVKEIFYTLQGEGANAGTPAVFLRFAGCNLWSGREEDRASAVCRFCDTDFVGTDGPGGARHGLHTPVRPDLQAIATATMRWSERVGKRPRVQREQWEAPCLAN